MIKYTDFGAMAASDTVNALSLGAAVAESDTFPFGARIVVMTANVLSYFKFGVVATVPGDTTDGSAADTLQAGIPTVRIIPNFTTRGYITAGSALLSVDMLDGFTKGTTIVVKGAGVAGADLTQSISSINYVTRVITLGATASTTVVGTQVIFAPTIVSVISAGTPVITLAYYE